MKKLLGVVFALFLFCMPLGIEANDVLSYEYIGQPLRLKMLLLIILWMKMSM